MNGLGQAIDRVRVVPGCDLSRAALSAQDGFVLSRIDGQSTLGILCKLTGLGERTTLDSLRRLRDQGLIVVGDQRPNAPPHGASDRAAAKTATTPPAEDDGDAAVDLDPALRQRIGETHARLGAVSYFELLGVSETANVREIRRAYFVRSKEFHPDRYYNRRNLGRYREMLGDIFKQVAAAYRLLEDDDKRQAYCALLQQHRGSGAAGSLASPDRARRAARTGESPAVVRASGSSPTPRPTPSVATPDAGAAAQGRPRRPASGAYVHHRRIVERVVTGQAAARRIAAEPADETSLRKLQAGQGSGAAEGLGATETPARTSAVGQALDELEAAFAQWRPEEAAREQRRAEDRLRRRKMTVRTNPVEQRRQRAATFYAQGMKEVEEGKILAAAASFKLAVTYDPLEVSFKVAYEKAASGARQVTAESHLRRAIFQESLGRIEEAATLYARAAETCPTASYLTKAALAFLATGNLPQASEYAKHSVSVAPNSVEARIALARVHAGAGSAQHARRELEMALKLQPENSEAKQLLRSLK